VGGFLVDSTPDRVQRLQPTEQRFVGHGGPGAGEILEEVMVRVDEPGRHQTVVGRQDLHGRRTLIMRATKGLHPAVGDGDPTVGNFPSFVVHCCHERCARNQKLGHDLDSLNCPQPLTPEDELPILHA
jgi:hypothetical protein